MKSLAVTAELVGPISIPDRPLNLDALLAYSVCLRDHIPPATKASEVIPVDIPVKKETSGRFHLCSSAVYEVECRETRWINKRPVINEAIKHGQSIKRIQINAGHSKSYRIPYEVYHLKGDRLKWWLIGEPNELIELLDAVSHLGKKRSGGLGRVKRWHVEKCNDWEGFPVVLNGYPLRPLPSDWPGLAEDVTLDICTITYPYPPALNPNMQLCAIPGMIR